MQAPSPGQFWKTPFIWEPGCPAPTSYGALRFVEADTQWLEQALGNVMANSLDESDQFAVSRGGSARAAAELLAVCPEYFEHPADWWRAGVDAAGQSVGFVLPVLFKDRAKWKDGRPQGTIFYMGVLPECRGHAYAQALLAEATRIFLAANCWRIFCDTASCNAPMLNAFHKAGYKECSPWQRPVA